MAQAAVLVMSIVTSGSSICVASERLPAAGWTSLEQ